MARDENAKSEGSSLLPKLRFWDHRLWRNPPKGGRCQKYSLGPMRTRMLPVSLMDSVLLSR